MNMKDLFKVVDLQDKLSVMTIECSRRLNVLIDVQVFLQEDDPEGALKHLNEYLNK